MSRVLLSGPIRVPHVSVQLPAPAFRLPHYQVLSRIGHLPPVQQERVASELCRSGAFGFDSQSLELHFTDSHLHRALPKLLDPIATGHEIAVGWKELGVATIKSSNPGCVAPREGLHEPTIS